MNTTMIEQWMMLLHAVQQRGCRIERIPLLKGVPRRRIRFTGIPGGGCSNGRVAAIAGTDADCSTNASGP